MGLGAAEVPRAVGVVGVVAGAVMESFERVLIGLIVSVEYSLEYYKAKAREFCGGDLHARTFPSTPGLSAYSLLFWHLVTITTYIRSKSRHARLRTDKRVYYI